MGAKESGKWWNKAWVELLNGRHLGEAMDRYEQTHMGAFTLGQLRLMRHVKI